MNRKIIFILVFLVFVIFANSLQAGSIWAKRNKELKNFYADDKARYVGDVLTIKITEISETESKGKRNMQKTTSRTTSFDGKLGITHDYLEKVLPEDPIIPGFSMTGSSSNKLDGKADFTDERSFIDSITVVIIDVLPNHNLVVMGTRSRDIAGDIQTIEVSGIVRPSDISFDNIVQSERVANFRIVSKNTGISKSFNEPGWLGKFFDAIWPF